jgi:hypothetical protein
MKTKPFFVKLLILSGCWIGFLWALSRVFPAADPRFSISPAATLLFMAVCTGLYVGGRIALRRPSPHAFTGLVLSSVFIKMLVAPVFLLIYKRLENPEGKWFVGIFLLSYAVYTAYEVWFLQKMAKS